MEAILFPIRKEEQEADERKYRDDPIMLETLRHAWVTQTSLDNDIKAWRQPTEGNVSAVIGWLVARGSKEPTPYDYRRHARAHAARLLFKITDRSPSSMAQRIVHDDKWSAEEKADYWRCVAVCSTAWHETP